MEKQLKRVVFEFEDSSQKVLEGGELERWETICGMQSDYLLPGDTNYVLATNRLVQGFVPAWAVTRPVYKRGGRSNAD